MGGASLDPITYNDPDLVCYKFLAHAAGSSDPYSEAPGEQYLNFDFSPPWQGTHYERAIKPVVDSQSRVIAMWQLFKQSAAVNDGSIAPGGGTHPDGYLLYSWGPGASPIYLDPDVGVTLESTVGYQLEVLYNNATGTAGADQSGAEVCVTSQVPAHLAELTWVGTDSIAGTSASGNCNPNGPFPIHIIAGQPRMRQLGTHMKITVNRAAGRQDVIHDMSFSSAVQSYYLESLTLDQGDTITTDCSYSGFATFGTSTTNEICYFFTLAWPAGSLRGSTISAIIHGANSCM
jgi:hypothetical protein